MWIVVLDGCMDEVKELIEKGVNVNVVIDLVGLIGYKLLVDCDWLVFIWCMWFVGYYFVIFWIFISFVFSSFFFVIFLVKVEMYFMYNMRNEIWGVFMWCYSCKI